MHFSDISDGGGGQKRTGSRGTVGGLEGMICFLYLSYLPKQGTLQTNSFYAINPQRAKIG